MTLINLIDNFNNTTETPVNNNQGFTFGMVDEDQSTGIS